MRVQLLRKVEKLWSAYTRSVAASISRRKESREVAWECNRRGECARLRQSLARSSSGGSGGNDGFGAQAPREKKASEREASKSVAAAATAAAAQPLWTFVSITHRLGEVSTPRLSILPLKRPHSPTSVSFQGPRAEKLAIPLSPLSGFDRSLFYLIGGILRTHTQNPP